jgi:hypothetical protein
VKKPHRGQEIKTELMPELIDSLMHHRADDESWDLLCFFLELLESRRQSETI